MEYHTIFSQNRNEHHSFSIAFARKYGINEALLFENIYYWVKFNCYEEKNFKDGYYWTYNKQSTFAEYFPELTPKQIRNAFNHLIEEGLIVTANYNPNKFVKTLWYTVTEKGFREYADDFFPENSEQEYEQQEEPSDTENTSIVSKLSIRNAPEGDANDAVMTNATDNNDNIGLPQRANRIAPEGNSRCPTGQPNTKYNTSLSNTNIISSNLLTTHVRARELGQAELESHIFERIGRNLSYPEKRIVSEWVDADEEIEIIDLAIGDNLFRKDKFDLKYARETINTWKSRGAATSTEIRNMILDDHVINLRCSIRKEDEDDILGRSEIYGLQMQRDLLNDSYKRKDYQEFARISTWGKSDKVAQYLTEDVRKLYYTYRQIAI